MDIVSIMEKKGEDNHVLLGRRIRSLRNAKNWTQQELGHQADVNYKFLGEIERGQQNPSFETLMKIADALAVDLMELFRFDQEISDRGEMLKLVGEIADSMPDGELRRLFMVLRALYP